MKAQQKEIAKASTQMTNEQNIYESHNFRSQTLAQFRWVAIIGQLLAVLIAYFSFQIEFDLLFALIVIGLWCIFNILQITLFANRLELDEQSGFIALLVDLCEIALLLQITGGLNNPFCAFIIVPAILAATTLSLRALITLNIITLAALALIGWFANPIIMATKPLELPPILRMAEFFALSILTIFLSYYARRIFIDNLRMTKALAASELALQREHRLSSLGALVAAYAHELGTPLATIRLTAADLLTTKLKADQYEDIRLILEQTERSAEILKSMGERGKADELVKTTTIAALIEEAALPHLDRGKEVTLDLQDGGQIYTQTSEAIIQGLRNLIQNAVDFATSSVTIRLQKTKTQLVLRIEDDGKGFPGEVLARAGEPYLRAPNSSRRKGYQGMGLGLFIAKTLLERSRAELRLANRPKPEHGGVVLIEWPLSAIEMSKEEARAALGFNQKVQA